MQKILLPDNNIAQMPLAELRQKWADLWGVQPHARIGRQMLEESLEFRLRGGFSAEQQARIDHLIAAYRRNPKSFDQGAGGLKPGTKLIRTFRGEKYQVLVKADGFEYRSQIYGSLSEVAYVITGSRWNGWVFFGLKKSGGKA
jgi:hypothetical protein